VKPVVQHEGDSSSDGLDFAWRVHAALNDWTAKVDTKASIVLSLETAILVAVIAFSAPKGVLGRLGGLPVNLFRLGVLLLAGAVVLSGLVVLPRLHRRAAQRDWEHNMIYFGHLKRWDIQDLTDRLQELKPKEILGQLAKQLVTMSRIAWRKHTLLQYSMAFALLGVALVFLAALFRAQ
jgi:hypothetical protein